MEEFYDVQIDEELETVKDEHKKTYKNSFAGHKIIEMNINFNWYSTITRIMSSNITWDICIHVA